VGGYAKIRRKVRVLTTINLGELGYTWAGYDRDDISWVAILSPRGEVARCEGLAALTPVPRRAPREDEGSLVEVMLRGLSRIAAGHAVQKGM